MSGSINRSMSWTARFSQALLVFLLVGASVANAATEPNEKPTAARAVDQQLVAQINENLEKIENSISLTKKKIRTSKEIQFLPELFLSLAELLVEKSRLKYAHKIETSAGKPTAELDFTAARQVKLEAIEALKEIEERYPNYENLDRVVFAIAHEYREIGEDDEALKAFKRLLDKFPKSSFWPEAQYGIANIYYDKKDFQFALEQYQKIFQRPEAKIMVMMANYKIGLCYMQMDKSLLALQSFERVMDTVEFDASQLPQDFKRKDVREEALVASVKPLSDLAPQELQKYPKYQYVLSYYRNLAPSRVAFRSVLGRLGKRMTLKNRHIEAAQSWYALLEVANDSNQGKEALEAFYLAMKKAKKEDYPENSAYVISQFLWELKNTGAKDYPRFEPVLRDIATSFHKSALQTKRPDDLKRAIAAYKDYLWIFPQTKYRQGIALNMAEAAFHAGRFVESGLGYAKLTRVKNARRQKDYFMSSFDAFNKAFKEQEKLSLLEKIQGRSVYIRLAEVFGKKYKNDPAQPSVLFNLSKSLYDGQDYASAATRLHQLLRQYPNDKNAAAAAILLLDCFYVRDDFKGLAKKGQELLSLPLASNLKQDIQRTVRQAQFKKVKSLAGDFASESYAEQFLKFAKQAGKSTLGETALLEAFLSLKAAQDPKALQVGEQYIGQYGNTEKAKDVLNQMIQLALAAADFGKAATYLAAYSQKYPTDDSSSRFAATAASFYEALGDIDQATKVYLAIGKLERAADIFYKVEKWNDLNKVAQKVSGAKGLYYQGLSLYRLGQKENGLRLLERAFSTDSQDPQERSYAAHAGYLLALKSFAGFRATSPNGVRAITDIKQKAEALAESDKVLWKTIETGVGKWVIASMQMQAVMYLEFANFLKRGPAPQPLSAEQYQKMVAPQIQTYLQNAKTTFAKCVTTSEEAEVFSEFVEACRTQKLALVNEAASERLIVRNTASRSESAPELRAQLLKDPQNTSLLHQMGQGFMRQGDYTQASVIYNRVLEVKRDDANGLAQLGVVQMFQRSWDDAYAYFQQALKSDAKNPTALWGVAGLYRKFGYKEKMNRALERARASGTPTSFVHPTMKF